MLQYAWPSGLKAKWKEPDPKGHMLYDSIYRKCPNEANPQRQKADWWLPKAGGKEKLGVPAKRVWGFYECDAKVLELDISGGLTTGGIY